MGWGILTRWVGWVGWAGWRVVWLEVDIVGLGCLKVGWLGINWDISAERYGVV